MKQTDSSSVSGTFSWETTHRRQGELKQFSMGKCPIKSTYLFIITMKIVPKNKFGLQSLGLWSFNIVLYGRNRFLHLAKIEDQDIFNIHLYKEPIIPAKLTKIF
jgi:hypothetical protein